MTPGPLAPSRCNERVPGLVRVRLFRQDPRTEECSCDRRGQRVGCEDLPQAAPLGDGIRAEAVEQIAAGAGETQPPHAFVTFAPVRLECSRRTVRARPD